MSVTAFTAAYVEIASQDVTSQVGSCQVTITEPNVATTNFSNSGKITRLPVGTDMSISLTFDNPDADESAAASILKLMWDGSLIGGGSGTYAIAIRAASGSTATAAAPKYSGTFVCSSGWQPIGGQAAGSVVSQQTITFDNQSSTITRATS